MPRLSELFSEADTRMVVGLTADSREVKPGFVFVAVPGARANGLAYVPGAIASGAVAIVAEEKPAGLPARVAFVPVPNARLALAPAAARLHPLQPETIVAVTGTSGKTSTTVFARQIWARLGVQAASLGTIGVVKPDGATYGALTTPDPVLLHETLDGLAREGVTHLAMEASSHGLEQHRLDEVRLAAGAFLNLSRDHLDYHGTMEAYFAAKLRLISSLLGPGRPVVIAAGAPWREPALAAARAHGLTPITIGAADSDVVLREVTRTPAGQHLAVEFFGRRQTIELPLIGDFQAWNALAAAALCVATGSDEAGVFAALARLEGVPGRLDNLGTVNGAAVIVDFAHKPEAIVNVLAALRPYATGRLIIVFGCGGDRDAGKRPLMGAAAVAGADIVIVTDDNPRSEAPAAIRQAIMAAAPGAIEIGDRKQAIGEAVAMARSGDIVLIAGKGHETGQIVGDTVLPFSDHQVARAAMQEARR
jgi:UDP-N-acetylmuramoyl-L-alanyl-D-glutamate--2,6-diaminopimelate ligase